MTETETLSMEINPNIYGYHSIKGTFNVILVTFAIFFFTMYIFQLLLHFFVTPVLSSVQLVVEISFPFIIICYGAVSLLFELKYILNLKPFLELPYSISTLSGKLGNS